MSRRHPRGYRKRQVPGKALDIERDLQRLTQWLEARRIKAMLHQRGEHSLTVADVNQRLFPWYDKGRTHWKEASPGLLLLRAAESKGLVEQTGPGYWRDARYRTTVGQAIKGGPRCPYVA